MTRSNEIRALVERLNQARNAYYNGNNPIMSDYEYDKLFDQLQQMEKETGITFASSPTQTVGYEVESELKKVKHSHKLLSLNKTKSIDELTDFIGNKKALMSLKLDGLTCLLTYRNGKLYQAETRGNGEIGEIITHNAKVFSNIPLSINCKHLELEGEAIITYDDFELINRPLTEKYKNPRNLASGSVRQLDSRIAAERHIKFIVWKISSNIDIESFSGRLEFAKELGFDIVPYQIVDGMIENTIEVLKHKANELGYPIDGLVCTYDDVSYGESLGETGHHPKHSIAYKFYDEEVETVITDVDWTIGKTGVITPTAVFEPIEIDGTTVSRASLHNVSIMQGLELSKGDMVTVYKANQIIPQISDNLTKMRKHYFVPPDICPACGGSTKIVQDNECEVLICTNLDCPGKLLKKLVHFCSKNAINIDGLSESTLQFLIKKGWVKEFKDLYYLEKHKEEWERTAGFGKRSVEKILANIEQSRKVTFGCFLYSLSIPLIGKSKSEIIEKHETNKRGQSVYCNFVKDIREKYDWTMLDDFGEAISNSLTDYCTKHMDKIEELSREFFFEIQPTKQSFVNVLKDMVFVITGNLKMFENRDKLVEDIEAHGGKIAGSVSKNTDYLIANDTSSNSSKLKKAKQLGVKIIDEQNYILLREGDIM